MDRVFRAWVVATEVTAQGWAETGDASGMRLRPQVMVSFAVEWDETVEATLTERCREEGARAVIPLQWLESYQVAETELWTVTEVKDGAKSESGAIASDQD